MSKSNEAEELLTKEFEFETTIEVSVMDLLGQFNESQKRALVRELIDEVTVEDNQELILNDLSLGDKYKLDHFKSVMDHYELDQLETILP
jgi:hypothetical protein